MALQGEGSVQMLCLQLTLTSDLWKYLYGGLQWSSVHEKIRGVSHMWRRVALWLLKCTDRWKCVHVQITLLNLSSLSALLVCHRKLLRFIHNCFWKGQSNQITKKNLNVFLPWSNHAERCTLMCRPWQPSRFDNNHIWHMHNNTNSFLFLQFLALACG